MQQGISVPWLGLEPGREPLDHQGAPQPHSRTLWPDPSSLTPTLSPHCFVRKASHFIPQQLLGPTYFCDFPLIFFFFWWLFMMSSLSYPSYHLWLFLCILCNPPWMSPPPEATLDNPPPRRLVLLYALPPLPPAKWNAPLPFLLCLCSFRVRNVTSIWIFSVTPPTLRPIAVPEEGSMLVGWVWGGVS